MIFVVVRTQFEALHHWPDAPDSESYLRQPHRHMFVVQAEIEVKHEDREIEINELSRWLHRTLYTMWPREWGRSDDVGTLSCEHIARVVTDLVRSRFKNRWMRVTVLEDGILGAGVVQEATE